MKNLIFSRYYVPFVCLSLFFSGCNNIEKDWKNAKETNSISVYQSFIKNHSSSVYKEKAQNAIDSIELASILKAPNVDSLKIFIKNHSASIYKNKATNIIDSLELIFILKFHNPDSLNLFIKTHSNSLFLTNSKSAIDSVDWNIAVYSRDTVALRNYINKYPNSNKKQQAENLILNIKFPPVTISNANSLCIGSKGKGVIYGDLQFKMNGAGPMEAEGKGPNKVYIWRDFLKDELPMAKKQGLHVGAAYLKTNNDKFKFIRDVDLTKSDKQLCAEFGIKIK